MMRVELCAWKDAVAMLDKYPNINKHDLADGVKITAWEAEEFKTLYKILFPEKFPKRQPTPISETNKKYYKRNRVRILEEIKNRKAA